MSHDTHTQDRPPSDSPEPKLYATTNMSQAQYLLMKGLRIHKAERVNRTDGHGPEMEFEFLDPEGVADTLCLEFLSSESADYDDAGRRLRALLNHGSRRRRRRRKK